MSKEDQGLVAYCRGEHHCLGDNDPLVGIFNDTKEQCCPIKFFMSKSGPEDNFTAIRNNLTPFGRRLVACSTFFGVDIYETLKVNDDKFTKKHFYDMLHDMLIGMGEKPYSDGDMVQWLFGGCEICYSECRFVRKPPCCRKSICQECWTTFLKANIIQEGIRPSSYNIVCYGCNKIVPYQQALASTEPNQLKMLRHDSSQLLAHCPNCLHEVEKEIEVKTSCCIFGTANKYQKSICKKCDHEFCARCGSDPHPKNSCYDVQHNEAGLTLWMNGQHPNQNDFQVWISHILLKIKLFFFTSDRIQCFVPIVESQLPTMAVALGSNVFVAWNFVLPVEQGNVLSPRGLIDRFK